MKIINQPIVSKATKQVGHISRTYLNKVYVKFLYDTEIPVNIKKFDEYLISSDETRKEIDKRIKKLYRENRINQ